LTFVDHYLLSLNERVAQQIPPERDIRKCEYKACAVLEAVILVDVDIYDISVCAARVVRQWGRHTFVIHLVRFE
jgi:hypothetical protein